MKQEQLFKEQQLHCALHEDSTMCSVQQNHFSVATSIAWACTGYASNHGEEQACYGQRVQVLPGVLIAAVVSVSRR